MNRALITQAIDMISRQDLSHWSDAHDRVTLAALREYRETWCDAPEEPAPNPAQLRTMARPAPAPCSPFHRCERQERDLGACIAGECNPPAPAGVGGTDA